MSSNSPASINHRLQVALAALCRDLEQAKDHGVDGEFVTTRNDLLRHFSHCSREFMSFVLAYLESKYIKTSDLGEPEIIRQLKESGMINEDQHRLLVQMLDDQYKTQTEPSKSEAAILVKRIREYFRLMLETGKKIAVAMNISDKGEPHCDIHDLP